MQSPPEAGPRPPPRRPNRLDHYLHEAQPWSNVPAREAANRLTVLLNMVVDGRLSGDRERDADLRGFRVGEHLRNKTAQDLCARVLAAFTDPSIILSGADLNLFYTLVLEPGVNLPRLGVDTADQPFSWFIPVATGDPTRFVSARRELRWMHDPPSHNNTVALDRRWMHEAVAAFRVGAPIPPLRLPLESGDAAFNDLVWLYNMYGPEGSPVQRGINDWLRAEEKRFPTTNAPRTSRLGGGIDGLDLIPPAFISDPVSSSNNKCYSR